MPNKISFPTKEYTLELLKTPKYEMNSLAKKIAKSVDREKSDARWRKESKAVEDLKAEFKAEDAKKGWKSVKPTPKPAPTQEQLARSERAMEKYHIGKVEKEVTARDLKGWKSVKPTPKPGMGSEVLSKFRTNVGAEKLGELKLPNFGKIAAGAKEAEIAGKAGKVAGKLGKLGIAGLAIYGGIEALKKIGEKLKE